MGISTTMVGAQFSPYCPSHHQQGSPECRMPSVFPKLSTNHTLLLLLEMIYFEENGHDLLSTQGSLPGQCSAAGLFSIARVTTVEYLRQPTL